MVKSKKLKICFIGGSQAGIIGVLAVLSAGHRVLCAVAYSEALYGMLKILKIPLYCSVNDKNFVRSLKKADLLLSVHGREIVKKELIKLPRIGAINLHPYLYKYKGANPVERAFADRDFNASVGAHMMEEMVDEGRVLIEEFADAGGSKSVEEIYNRLYPLYGSVLLKVLDMVKDEKFKK